MRRYKLLPALLAAAAIPALAAAQEEEPAPPATERRAVIDAVSDALDSIDREVATEPEAAEAAEEAPAEEVPAEEAPDGDVGADEPSAEAIDEPSTEEVVDNADEAAVAEDEAAAPSEPPPPLTAEEREEVAGIAARGRALAAVAQAGILATRDMLARIADPEAAGIAGWVAVPEGNGVAVTFYAEAEDEPVAVYRGTVLGGRVSSREVHVVGERPPLNGVAARMAEARARVDALGHEPCGGAPFNVLALPPETADAPVHVFELTAPSEPGRFPFGGHFHSIVDVEGVTARPFANSCLIVDSPVPAEGDQPRPLAVTHLLDPRPTEIHLFLARQIGRPLLVVTGTPSRLWLVTGETIVEVRD